ncbi:methyltransferase [bacterium]|nr:methyltransferase [bacterium]
MTPRERVVATLKHREPDKIPLDIGGIESSGITGIAYNRLREHLGLGYGSTPIFDVYQQITKIEDDVRRVLKPDTIPLLIEPVSWKSSILPDGSPCSVPSKWNPVKDSADNLVVRNEHGTVTARMPSGGYYFESVHAPLADISDPAGLNAFARDIESSDWPFYADETLDSIGMRAQRLFEETDLAIVANLQLHLLAAGQQLRGYETFMMDLLLNKPLVHGLFDMLTDAYIGRCERYLDRVGTLVQVVLLNDDLGTQNGPMISPDCYREMLWPYQKRLFGFIKGKTGASILFHSCGAVSEFIPFLIEAGVDSLNPVQVSAAGMDTALLKKRFGGDITFWGGGCDTQRVLRSGSASQIREEVERRVGDLAPGGGFVFTQVHNIQPDVPPENIVAMIEAFERCRAYA